jgi:hypothetical protein
MKLRSRQQHPLKITGFEKIPNDFELLGALSGKKRLK